MSFDDLEERQRDFLRGLVRAYLKKQDRDRQRGLRLGANFDRTKLDGRTAFGRKVYRALGGDLNDMGVKFDCGYCAATFATEDGYYHHALETHGATIPADKRLAMAKQVFLSQIEVVGKRFVNLDEALGAALAEWNRLNDS